jgi:splicing suppressor protein 51
MFGENGGNGSNLKIKVDKDAVIAHYGDQRMSMQLRMLAEDIYGSPPAGSGPGTAMRKTMASMEAGGSGDGRAMSLMHVGL